MKTFQHFSPETVEEAASILLKFNGSARAIAGGTDLKGGLKDRIHPVYPQALVDLKHVKGLDDIRETDEGILIGAMVRLSDIETNPLIQEKYSILAQAARSVASPQIRNMGTIAGNICQEPRCWYYRNPDNTFHCLRKGGRQCNALTGQNRFHSIFGAARVMAPPCSRACPAGTDIPAYIEKIREKDLKGAASIILEYNPMPALTGRVCPHFCQADCNRNLDGDPVSVRAVEKFLGDYILDNAGELIEAPERESGKKIAVIGSGPAGLAAAYYLRQMGHSVTVFEKLSKAGGMLTHAIPSFRLAGNKVGRTIQAFSDTGIEFRLETNICGRNAIDRLRDDYHAVFLATGAWQPIKTGIPGEELTESGLDFLYNCNNANTQHVNGRVLVVGGGNVAMDAALTARRLGAQQVIVTCLECREEMPAHEWDVNSALEEGIELLTSWGVSGVYPGDDGQMAVELIQCTCVLDQAGCFNPMFDDSINRKLQVDKVIFAVGQKPVLDYLGKSRTELESGGFIDVDSATHAASVPGVFAGGEVTTGPATVIESIASGRRAAKSIHQYIMGSAEQPAPLSGHRNNLVDTPLQDHLESNTAVISERMSSHGLTGKENVSAFSREEVLREAQRCLNCGCVAASISDIAPALVALDAEIVTSKRTLAISEFFVPGLMTSTGLEEGELITAIKIPSLPGDNRQVYSKFRLRQAIDFPIASVAVCLCMNGSKVSRARIVLGAAAPVPLIAYGASEAVTGCEIDEKTAELSGKAGVVYATALGMNGYKIGIFSSLIKRALLTAAKNQ